jgi:hypothetical protein
MYLSIEDVSHLHAANGRLWKQHAAPAVLELLAEHKVLVLHGRRIGLASTANSKAEP